MEEERRSIPILRSILFVPAIVERFVARAPEAGADVVCLDLEDSVPPAEMVRQADHYLTILERQQGMEASAVRILPLVESAEGILNSREIAAASPRLAGLSLGAEDLAADMGLRRSEGAREIEWPRAPLATAAAAAGLIPIAPPEPAFGDLD